MSHLPRKDFLRQLALMVAGLVLRTPVASADVFSTVTASTDKAAPVNLNGGIIDLHCHPSLKMYLLDKHFWKRHHPRPGANEIRMQVDLRQLRSGHVSGMLATHYLVEAAAEREWSSLRFLWPLLTRFLKKFADKFENEDETNIDQVKGMIKIMNDQIAHTNRIQKDIQFVIATNYTDFEAALTAGHFPIAHAIE